jgi:hypothetical protein
VAWLQARLCALPGAVLGGAGLPPELRGCTGHGVCTEHGINHVSGGTSCTRRGAPACVLVPLLAVSPTPTLPLRLCLRMNFNLSIADCQLDLYDAPRPPAPVKLRSACLPLAAALQR